MTLIALAVDGQPKTDAAIRWTAQRAAADDSTVNLVSVAVDTGQGHVAAQRAVEAAASELTRLEPSLTVATSVASGDLFDELHLLSGACDLLVVGSDRPDPVRSTLHATLPMRLAGRARCDLVVVPAGWRGHAAGKVVVGWSEDAAGAAALDRAAREAEATGHALTIVYAWAPSAASSPFDADSTGAFITAIRDDAERALREAAAIARRDHPDLEVHTELHLGGAVGGLTTQDDAALIVVGTHRHTLLGEILLDPTDDALIRAVHDVPLLIASDVTRAGAPQTEVSRRG